MSNILYNGTEYDVVKTSDNPLQFEVAFDSHGKTKFQRLGGDWSVVNGADYLPNQSSIDEIGKILEGI
jgi:hypothetical protein